jgi:hypothetical protein
MTASNKPLLRFCEAVIILRYFGLTATSTATASAASTAG